MKIDGLTARQLEVARLVSEGYTTKRIASQLLVSERAVQFHIQRIAHTWHLSDEKDVRVQITQRILAKVA